MNIREWFGKIVCVAMVCCFIIYMAGITACSINAFAYGNEWRHGETQEEDPKILISGIMHSAVLELRSAEDIDPHELVERILMPHVDVLKMSKLILGRNWNEFTTEQQEEFAFLFEATLNKMYAAYLLELSLIHI